MQTGILAAQSPSTQPMKIFFDASCCPTLKLTLVESPLFLESGQPEDADIILFGTDTIAYIGKSELYRKYQAKCVCITESDIPTFRLPGLYAANAKGMLTHKRTETVNYFISAVDRGNLEIQSLIGKPVEKQYLYSFTGGSNSWARKRLFRHLKSQDDALIVPTDSYNHWQENSVESRRERNHWYANVMAASKFTLCPRGCGLSSYRLFESMSLGVVPVVISDKWKPVSGVDWSFALFIPERHIPKIDSIVRLHASEWQQRGRVAQDTYQQFFQRSVVPQLIFDKLNLVRADYSAGREIFAATVARTRHYAREAHWSLYKQAKFAALRASRLTGIPIPIHLNRPVALQLEKQANEK